MQLGLFDEWELKLGWLSILWQGKELKQVEELGNWEYSCGDNWLCEMQCRVRRGKFSYFRQVTHY